MLRTFDNPDKAAKRIRETEHRGDEISQDIGGDWKRRSSRRSTARRSTP